MGFWLKFCFFSDSRGLLVVSCLLIEFVGLLALCFWRLGVLALGFLRCAFNVGFLALSFWRWAFGIGLFTLCFPRVGFWRLFLLALIF